MLFNSATFLLFFLVVFALNWALGEHLRARHWMLLVASYLFYGAWNTWFLLLIILSTLLDYTLAILIEDAGDSPRRQRLMWVSVAANLGVLGFFKYFNFFIDSAYAFFDQIGLPFQYSSLSIILPVGISFYTFQSMSYVLDVYRRELPAERSLLRFALYIVFFPQLVAGPIVRPHDFLPQLANRFSLTREQFLAGAGLIWLGLFKKVILADFLARYSDAYFGQITAAHTALDAMLGVYAFAFQIYMDFSGYTDAAIGTALLLGYKIPRNFYYPYSAVSFADFWRRWHISLSSWFRDYVYIPLGGNRRRRERNLLVTMLLSGLWHGAAWHFVAWGAYHGLAMVGEGRAMAFERHAPRLLKQLLVFHLICVGWVLFRIEDLRQFGLFFQHLGVWAVGTPTLGQAIAAAICLGLFLYQLGHLRLEVKRHLLAWHPVAQLLAHAVLFFTIVVLGSFGKPFIYFQF